MTNDHQPQRDEAARAKLTAYALGELPQDEWASVENSLVAADREVAEATRRTIDEIRTLAGHLAEAARQTPLPPPSPSLREAVEKRLAEIERHPSAAKSLSQDRGGLAHFAESAEHNVPVPFSARLMSRRYRPVRTALLAVAALACLVLAAVTLWLPDETARRPWNDRSVAMNEQVPAELSAADKPRGLPLQTSPLAAKEPAEASPALARRGRPLSYEEQHRQRLPRDADEAAAPAAESRAASEVRSWDAGRVASSGERTISAKDSLGAPASPAPSPASSMSLDQDSGRGDSGNGAQFGASGAAPGKMEWPFSTAPSSPPQDRPGAERGNRKKMAEIPAIAGPASGPRPDSKQREGQAGMGGGFLMPGMAESTDPALVGGMGGMQGMPGMPGMAPAAAAPDAPSAGVAPDASRLSQAAAPIQLQLEDQRVREEKPQGRMSQFSYGADKEMNFAREAPGTEQYDPIVENDFLPVAAQPLSTFAIDVDTASYANVRRFLTSGRLPPPGAVRIEEMVNYFPYDYPPPGDERPFSASMEVTQCPWKTDHRLVRIGLKGQEIPREQRGATNLVFLIDVSGSMSDADKLPLVKDAMMLLVEQLTEDDRVAIVTYAGDAGLRLESTNASNKGRILEAIQSLAAGGSTHGSAGIQLAYQQAAAHFIPKGTNRVVLATDGDLNVGITDDDELVRLIQDKAKSGVFLTVLGFGTGNLKDAKLEKLADQGNGVYAYVDSLREAQRVLVEQLSGSLVTIAKDVKVQVEFNPAKVARYRLIGYENRALAAEDFANDRKDAGEIGAGHTVTALYEIVPAESGTADLLAGGQLRYQQDRRRELTEAAQSGELLTLKLRYKQPDGEKSQLLEFPLRDSGARFATATDDFRFAAAVAAFGMLLRDSEHAGEATLAAVEEYAAGALGEDPNGHRAEFLDLVRRARQITGQ